VPLGGSYSPFIEYETPILILNLYFRNRSINNIIVSSKVSIDNSHYILFQQAPSLDWKPS